MKQLTGLTVYDHLAGASVPLRASASFGSGLAGALWDRDETATSRYEAPTHHTLSLYVSGGDEFRRLAGQGSIASFGSGSLCLMPLGVTSEWQVTGPIRLLHLYISASAFERAVVEITGRDPAHVTLRDVPYFQDAALEGVMRSFMLGFDWDEPSERIAVSQGAQALLAYLISRMTQHGPLADRARGGLPPFLIRKLEDFTEEHLHVALSISDMAAHIGLSPYHFTRAFKRSMGESPHSFVLRKRIARAKNILAKGCPLAEVAALCGFSSQSHFTERFRFCTGVTPGQFTRCI